MTGVEHKENKNEYEIRVLTRPQIREIYEVNMTADFPPDELKPLRMMEMALDREKYICYGYFRGREMAAYAYFALLDKSVLIDYYAVDSKLRRCTSIITYYYLRRRYPYGISHSCG